MTSETFREHFETFAEAPNGIAKLRELILQLAVRGKLVPQDVNDEPAQELLSRIQFRPIGKEDSSTVSRKSIRPNVNSNHIGTLPRGWAKTRLGDVAKITMGNSPPGYSYNEHGEGVPLINGPVEFSEGAFGLTLRTKFTTEPTKFCKKDDLLICVRGSTTGRTNIAAFDACIGRGVAAIQAGEVQFYVNLFVFALRQAIFDMGTGATFPSISCIQIADIPFPLPPLAEQRRIVKKVDQLLGLCDKVAARQSVWRDKRSALAGATLNRLVSARSSAEFAVHTHRLHTHFDQLFDTPTTIPKLRQAILQLAVQGQLVPQTDEDNDLVSRNTVVGDYLRMQNGYAFKSQWFQPEGIRLIRNANIGIGRLNWSDVAKISNERAEEYERFKMVDGDIVLSLDRPIITTGLKVARVTNDDLPSLLLQRVARPVFNDDAKVDVSYFYMWLQSPIFIKAIDPGKSYGVPHISTKEVERLAFAPPTEATQKLIVSKVLSLLSQCERAAEIFSKQEEHNEYLMNALIFQILGVEQTQKMPNKNVKKTQTSSVTPTDPLKSAKEPISSATELAKLFAKKGDQTTTARLLSASRLTDDVDLFFQLLREARDCGDLECLKGLNQPIRRVK